MVTAYKLMRQRKDGTLGSLFIDRSTKYRSGIVYHAATYTTDGYSERFGFHAVAKPHAPHLSTKGRVWVKVMLLEDLHCPIIEHHRPVHQGGLWYTAPMMEIVEVLDPQPVARKE
jgi:hypothetical protein